MTSRRRGCGGVGGGENEPVLTKKRDERSFSLLSQWERKKGGGGTNLAWTKSTRANRPPARTPSIRPSVRRDDDMCAAVEQLSRSEIRENKGALYSLLSPYPLLIYIQQQQQQQQEKKRFARHDHTITRRPTAWRSSPVCMTSIHHHHHHHTAPSTAHS